MQTIASPSIKPNSVEVAVSENLLGSFEELEDRVIIQEWLPKLKAGPFVSGALRWEDIEAEWDDETTI